MSFIQFTNFSAVQSKLQKRETAGCLHTYGVRSILGSLLNKSDRFYIDMILPLLKKELRNVFFPHLTLYIFKKTPTFCNRQRVSVLQHTAHVGTPSSFAVSGPFKLWRFDARDFGQWAGMFQDLLRVEHRRVSGHLPRAQMPPQHSTAYHGIS
jgi:hypothetical protein